MTFFDIEDAESSGINCGLGSKVGDDSSKASDGNESDSTTSELGTRSGKQENETQSYEDESQQSEEIGQCDRAASPGTRPLEEKRVGDAVPESHALPEVVPGRPQVQQGQAGGDENEHVGTSVSPIPPALVPGRQQERQGQASASDAENEHAGTSVSPTLLAVVPGRQQEQEGQANGGEKTTDLEIFTSERAVRAKGHGKAPAATAAREERSSVTQRGEDDREDKCGEAANPGTGGYAKTRTGDAVPNEVHPSSGYGWHPELHPSTG